MKFLPAMLLAQLSLAITSIASEGANASGDAITKGLELLQKSAFNYPAHRDCFACHHQTMPLLAMVEARRIGMEVDMETFDEQAKFTHKFFNGRTEQVAEGKGVGGRGMTAAYALWTLDLGELESDTVTDALVSYLLKNQKEDGRWQPPSYRPPMEESSAMTTFLAAYYMDSYAGDEVDGHVRVSVDKALRWLSGAKQKTQEDLNARLWTGIEFERRIEAAKLKFGSLDTLREPILKNQREDGGWSQEPDNAELKSDAYATGQTLYILSKSGLAPDHPAIQSARKFLLSTQFDDGSWFVKTRAKPVQKFFDNGDPHGKSQFISIAATGWAVAALCRTEGKTKTGPSPPSP